MIRFLYFVPLALFSLSAYALTLPNCSGNGMALMYDAVNGFACGSSVGSTISHIGKTINTSVAVGAIALGTKTVTVNGLTGVLAGDVCTVSWGAAQSLTAGLVLSGCRASADGQVDIQFATPIAIGINPGTISLNIAWMG